MAITKTAPTGGFGFRKDQALALAFVGFPRSACHRKADKIGLLTVLGRNISRWQWF
jgi:hypothetical protein